MGREKMMNSKSVHQAEKLTDAELSKKPGRYQFIEALLSFCDCISHCGITALIFRNIAAAGILIFAGIPRNFDMSDIDGMRKYYVSSLERMGSLLDIIEKSPSFFGD